MSLDQALLQSNQPHRIAVGEGECRRGALYTTFYLMWDIKVVSKYIYFFCVSVSITDIDTVHTNPVKIKGQSVIDRWQIYYSFNNSASEK